jgi:hypothetical protein
LPTRHEGDREPDPRGSSSFRILAAAALVAVAVVVFAVLPRWIAAPVVTTQPEAAAPVPSATPEPRREAAPPASPEGRPGASGAPELVEAPAAPVEGPHAPPSAPPASAFEAAVGEGLAAADRGDVAEARAAFARAEAAQPGSAVVKDGLARADGMERAVALEGHRGRALAAEAVEDWRAAQVEYEAALKLDGAVRFAVEGQARAHRRASLDERLEGYLGRPDRLAADEVAREAEAALDRAEEVDPLSPRLRRQVEALRAQLVAARTAVPVRLLSDEQTEVSVLRVGSLGRFKDKTVGLRPGSYVVVGTRRGYRDRRQTLVVPAGRSPEPMTIRCDEAL